MISRLPINAKDIILGSALCTLPFVLPAFPAPLNVHALFSVSFVVFAVVAGFFITGGMAAYRRLQTLISEENAALISLARLAKRADEDKANRIREAIDAYMVRQLDTGTLNQHRITQPQVDQLAEAIDALPKNSAIYDHMQGIKKKVLVRFQEISLVAKQGLTPTHWLTVILLGVLVAISVLGMRDGGWVMNAIAGTMMIVLQAVLVTLRDSRRLGFSSAWR